MAEAKKFKIGGIWYNVKDETARNGKVSKSGDTMTGTIVLADTGLRTPEPGGYETDKFGNFKHTSDTATNTWNIKSYDGTDVFGINFETGTVTKGIWGGNSIPIEKGGTGKTNAADAWSALGGGSIGKKSSLAASDIPNLSTDKLTSGTLPIDRGGTGKTNAADAWSALGGGSIGKKSSLAASDIPNLSTDKLTSGTLPIARGGTGGTDSGWLTLSTSSSYTGTIYYRKIGTFCEVVSHGALKLTAALTDTGGTLLNTLPSGYRPSKEFYCATSSTYSSGVLQIGPNGNMRFYKERSLENWDTGRTFYIHTFFFCS